MLAEFVGPPAAGGIPAALDHLVYVVPDLEAAASEFERVTSIAPVPGGRHLGRGTRNELVGLRHGPGGGSSYLEIIGPDTENPAAAGVVVPFGVDGSSPARLATWAIHPADIVAAVGLSRDAGADLGPIWPLSRRRPDGVLLSWRLASPSPAPFNGVTPFVIDWGSSPHPSADTGMPLVELAAIRFTSPDPDGVGRVLEALGMGSLSVSAGPPSVAVVFTTPSGRFELS